MKKIVSLCLLMVLFVGVCAACFVACEEGPSDSPSYSYSYEPEVLTKSEKEEVAEDEALRYISQRYPFNGYTFTCVVSVSDYGAAEVEDFDYKIQ